MFVGFGIFATTMFQSLPARCACGGSIGICLVYMVWLFASTRNAVRRAALTPEALLVAHSKRVTNGFAKTGS